MNDALKVTRLLLMAIEVAQAAGVNISEVVAASDKARAEGRDLTDEELGEFRAEAQAAIDEAKRV